MIIGLGILIMIIGATITTAFNTSDLFNNYANPYLEVLGGIIIFIGIYIILNITLGFTIPIKEIWEYIKAH